MNFDESLEFGRVGESKIMKFLKNKYRYSMLPVCDQIIENGKAPQLFMNDNKSLIVPDFIGLKNNEMRWFEAKTKSTFSWHRNLKTWTTGIDLRHYNDYCTVEDTFGFPVGVLFLHLPSNQTNIYGEKSPSGLYYNSLKHLRKSESHRHSNWASGMVYWSIVDLIKIAEYQEVLNNCRR